MNKGKTAQAVDNQHLQQLFVQLIYSPIKKVALGGEVILGERTTFGGETGAVRRADLLGRWSFWPRRHWPTRAGILTNGYQAASVLRFETPPPGNTALPAGARPAKLGTSAAR